ncbi:hypothetical protein Tco_1359957 [Tanacetum coccineum]
MSRIGMNMLASKGNILDVWKVARWFGEAEESFLHNVSEDKETAETASGVVMKDVCGEAMKCACIGSGLDEMRYIFRDTKSHQVIRSRDITFVDLIYGAKSATDSSSLMKPIQESQVVLVDIPDNLAENYSIVAEHGLSSEITQSPDGSLDTSEGSKNSGSFEEHPPRREAPRLYRYEGPAESPWLHKESVQWKKAINEEIVSLEKNQTCSLVRLPARKNAPQRLWMFKVKEEKNSNERYEAPLSIVVAGAFLCGNLE